MCYIGCKYERFNPITGDCKCVSKEGCVLDTECPYCGREYEDEDCACPDCDE